MNLMDNKCFDAVIAEMKPLLDGQNFKLDGEVYKNSTKAVKIIFDDTSKMFILKAADIIEEEIGDYSVLSSWLFDDDQTVKDAAAVGVDFADTLRSNMGLKKATRATSANSVALPTTEKGDAVTITALTQKLLAIFPEYKEEYKATVAKYGKFLHQEFFMSNFVPSIKTMLANKEANRKPIKKLFDMFSELYVEGDGETVDQIVAIISAAVFENQEFTDTFKENTEGNEHLQKSVEDFIPFIKSNKKLREALIK